MRGNARPNVHRLLSRVQLDADDEDGCASHYLIRKEQFREDNFHVDVGGQNAWQLGRGGDVGLRAHLVKVLPGEADCRYVGGGDVEENLGLGLGVESSVGVHGV